MAQYINKSALVAEIEKRRDESWLGIYTKEKGIIFDITDEILSFIDTLDVLTLDDIKEMENQAFMHGIEAERNKNIDKEIRL